MGPRLADQPGGSTLHLALGRYLTHAVVLVIVLTVSGYASVSRQLPIQLSLHTDASALMMNQTTLAMKIAGTSGYPATRYGRGRSGRRLRSLKSAATVSA